MMYCRYCHRYSPAQNLPCHMQAIGQVGGTVPFQAALVGEGDRSRGQPCSPGVPFGALPAPLRCSHCSWEHQSCSWEALWVRGEPWRGCYQDYTSSVGLWREAGRTAGMGLGRMQQAQAAEPGCAHCMQHPSRLYPCQLAPHEQARSQHTLRGSAMTHRRGRHQHSSPAAPQLARAAAQHVAHVLGEACCGCSC